MTWRKGARATRGPAAPMSPMTPAALKQRFEDATAHGAPSTIWIALWEDVVDAGIAANEDVLILLECLSRQSGEPHPEVARLLERTSATAGELSDLRRAVETRIADDGAPARVRACRVAPDRSAFSDRSDVVESSDREVRDEGETREAIVMARADRLRCA